MIEGEANIVTSHGNLNLDERDPLPENAWSSLMSESHPEKTAS